MANQERLIWHGLMLQTAALSSIDDRSPIPLLILGTTVGLAGACMTGWGFKDLLLKIDQNPARELGSQRLVRIYEKFMR